MSNTEHEDFYNESLEYSDELDERNRLYTLLLKQYTSNQKRIHIARLIFKYVFFIIICFSIVYVIIYGANVMLVIAQKNSVSLSDFGVALTGVSSILGVIIVLPKIIAEHLFPKEGDQAESDLVVTMQKFDLDCSSDDNGEFWIEDEQNMNESVSGKI